MTVLNMNTKREQGRKAQMGNIMAAKVRARVEWVGREGACALICLLRQQLCGGGGTGAAAAAIGRSRC